MSAKTQVTRNKMVTNKTSSNFFTAPLPQELFLKSTQAQYRVEEKYHPQP